VVAVDAELVGASLAGAGLGWSAWSAELSLHAARAAAVPTNAVPSVARKARRLRPVGVVGWSVMVAPDG
jgi:hypothetical protein